MTENYFIYDGWNMVQELSSVAGLPQQSVIAVEPQTPESGTTKLQCFYDYVDRRVDKRSMIILPVPGNDF